jgi:hypothetical protein
VSRWNADWLRKPIFTKAEQQWRQEAMDNDRLVQRDVQVNQESWRRGLPDDRWDRSTTDAGIDYLFYAMGTLARAIERIESKLDAIEDRIESAGDDGG